MKAGDLVRFKDAWWSRGCFRDVGLVIKIWKDSALMSAAELQVKILWGDSSISQHTINLFEVINESR